MANHQPSHFCWLYFSQTIIHSRTGALTTRFFQRAIHPTLIMKPLLYEDTKAIPFKWWFVVFALEFPYFPCQSGGNTGFLLEQLLCQSPMTESNVNVGQHFVFVGSLFASVEGRTCRRNSQKSRVWWAAWPSCEKMILFPRTLTLLAVNYKLIKTVGNKMRTDVARHIILEQD